MLLLPAARHGALPGRDGHPPAAGAHAAGLWRGICCWILCCRWDMVHCLGGLAFLLPLVRMLLACGTVLLLDLVLSVGYGALPGRGGHPPAAGAHAAGMWDRVVVGSCAVCGIWCTAWEGWPSSCRWCACCWHVGPCCCWILCCLWDMVHCLGGVAILLPLAAPRTLLGTSVGQLLQPSVGMRSRLWLCVVLFAGCSSPVHRPQSAAPLVQAM